jgi:hypothetical protein
MDGLLVVQHERIGLMRLHGICYIDNGLGIGYMSLYIIISFNFTSPLTAICV